MPALHSALGEHDASELERAVQLLVGGDRPIEGDRFDGRSGFRYDGA
jgi:hypothetical protein